MAQYTLKPGTPIEAEQYHSGLQDGFLTFTSDTIGVTPIPANLDRYAHFYTVVNDPDDWTVSIPFVGDNIPVLPDDYVITPDEGDKYVMSKAEFESKYELAGGGGS